MADEGQEGLQGLELSRLPRHQMFHPTFHSPAIHLRDGGELHHEGMLRAQTNTAALIVQHHDSSQLILWYNAAPQRPGATSTAALSKECTASQRESREEAVSFR